MVTFSAIVCAALLAASPDAPLHRGDVLTQQQLWERLQDPTRSIFNLPQAAEPLSISQLELRQARWDDHRSLNAKLLPLRLAAATLGGGLMLTAGTYLASALIPATGGNSKLLPSLYFGSMIALPFIPFAVTRFGNAAFGHGTWIPTLAGTLVGYFGSMLLFTLATEVSYANQWAPPRIGGLALRMRQPETISDDRIGTLAPQFVPVFALAPLLGAVIGYELSSHSRLNSSSAPYTLVF